MAFSACSLSSLFCLLLRICRAKNLLASLRGTKQSPTIQSEYSGLEYLLSFMVSLMAAKAYFFCLDTKETKSQVRRLGFFAAQGHCPANRAKPGLLYFYPAVAMHFAFALLQKSAMPCHYTGHHRFA